MFLWLINSYAKSQSMHGNCVVHWCIMLRCMEVSWSTSHNAYHWTDITDWLWWSDNNNTKNDFSVRLFRCNGKFYQSDSVSYPTGPGELCTHSQGIKKQIFTCCSPFWRVRTSDQWFPLTKRREYGAFQCRDVAMFKEQWSPSGTT